MDINRNNYEEFFLLYADHELSVDQQREVEAFVLTNPDLEPEFRMILDSRLKPDLHIVFEDKDLLLKEEKQPVTFPVQDYQSALLLYVDDELDREARNEVERLVKEHPVLQEELDLLRKTKLTDEPVVFRDKSLLYRREPVVFYLRILGWTAAAAVLLFAWVRISRQPDLRTQLVKVASKGANIQAPAQIKGAAPVTPGHSSPLHEGVRETAKAVVAPKEMLADLKMNKEDPSELARKQYQSERKAVVDEMITSNAGEGGSHQKVLLKPETISLPAVSLMKETPDQGAQDVAAGPQEINPYAKQVSIQEPYPGNEDGIKIMAFSAKKNTMRGIFRKVSRVLGKTTNADDENRRDILIGNVQVGVK